ncbi:hypothetical protein BJ508DRAFT_325426 [Ascobolus immersus RN42]|uniref:Uncharacterized protein n=1 Tax=Ascobolus immersus RN42 TaxID=1160509 RepID=A0A3N4IAC9_ASCIM|nr:hypothetical protein BJ508DRAFT_325426 [Ascobolus immersus RN42]
MPPKKKTTEPTHPIARPTRQTSKPGVISLKYSAGTALMANKQKDDQPMDDSVPEGYEMSEDRKLFKVLQPKDISGSEDEDDNPISQTPSKPPNKQPPAAMKAPAKSTTPAKGSGSSTKPSSGLFSPVSSGLFSPVSNQPAPKKTPMAAPATQRFYMVNSDGNKYEIPREMVLACRAETEFEAMQGHISAVISVLMFCQRVYTPEGRKDLMDMLIPKDFLPFKEDKAARSTTDKYIKNSIASHLSHFCDVIPGWCKAYVDKTAAGAKWKYLATERLIYIHPEEGIPNITASRYVLHFLDKTGLPLNVSNVIQFWKKSLKDCQHDKPPQVHTDAKVKDKREWVNSIG